MKDEELGILFDSIGKLLSNQDKIMKHLGINSYDREWGYSDTDTERLSNECYGIAVDYREID